MSRNAPLSACVEQGELRISIGLDELRAVLNARQDSTMIRIADIDVFATELAAVLVQDTDGEREIYRFFEEMMDTAARMPKAGRRSAAMPDHDPDFREFERAGDEFFAELDRQHHAQQRVIDELLQEAIEAAKGTRKPDDA